MLAIGMLALLIGVLAVGALQSMGSEDLDEAVWQYETMLRMARADAANRGRRFRIVFRAEDANAVMGSNTDEQAIEPVTAAGGPGGVSSGVGGAMEIPTPRVMWEPQPLAEPGTYLPYTERGWPRSIRADLAVMVSSERIGDSAFQLLTYGQEQIDRDRGDDQPLHAITFRPDGGSDSARIVLASKHAEDKRVGVIEIDGVTGVINAGVMTQTEWAELEESREP